MISMLVIENKNFFSFLLQRDLPLFSPFSKGNEGVVINQRVYKWPKTCFIKAIFK